MVFVMRFVANSLIQSNRERWAKEKGREREEHRTQNAKKGEERKGNEKKESEMRDTRTLVRVHAQNVRACVSTTASIHDAWPWTCPTSCTSRSVIIINAHTQRAATAAAAYTLPGAYTHAHTQPFTRRTRERIVRARGSVKEASDDFRLFDIKTS